MDNSTIDALTRALDFGSARMGAISGNLSNLSTPGYKRQDVSFDALLQDASGSANFTGRTDNPRDLSTTPDDAQSGPAVVTQSNGSARQDGNNVDVDAEGARLATTELFYDGAAQMLSGQFAALKYAIAGGR